MTSSLPRTARLLPAIMLAGALALALQPSMAAAQADPSDKADVRPASVNPDVVGGVVVETPRPHSKLEDIPPDKAAAFDEEAAKNEAWKRYRRSTPPLSAGALGQADDYPGLQSLLPSDQPPADGLVPLR
jgi:hypothetical protein